VENLVQAIQVLWKGGSETSDLLMDLIGAIGNDQLDSAEAIIHGLLEAPTVAALPKLGDKFRRELATAEPKDKGAVMSRWWKAVREERGRTNEV